MNKLLKSLTKSLSFWILLGIGALVLIIKQKFPKLRKSLSKVLPLVADKEPLPSAEEIDRLIDEEFNGGQEAQNIKAMWRLESGSGTNSISRNHNNIFSMKQTFKRPNAWQYLTPTIESDGNIPFVGYNTVKNAINDLALWFTYNGIFDIPKDPAAFVKRLKKKKYFTTSEAEYLAGIKRFLPKTKLKPRPPLFNKEVITEWWNRLTG